MGRSSAKLGGYLPWMVLGKFPSHWASIGMVTMAVTGRILLKVIDLFTILLVSLIVCV
jgi:hypothetical protein